MLTGLDDEQRGIEAVAAGAQDYLVKGQIDGQGLARAVRYAVERRRADEARQQLEVARLHAEENARLERGLLPAPLVSDPELLLSRALPPRPPARAARRRLLRRGPGRRRHRARRDRRRLAGTARTRRRSASACGSPGARWCSAAASPTSCCRRCSSCTSTSATSSWMFTTLCMVTIAARPAQRPIRLAGPPAAAAVAGDGIEPLDDRRGRPAARRASTDARWPPREHELPEQWSLLLYTDGLIEGRTGVGAARLGGEGLVAMVRGELATRGDGARAWSRRWWSAPRSSTAARCSTTWPRCWCSGGERARRRLRPASGSRSRSARSCSSASSAPCASVVALRTPQRRARASSPTGSTRRRSPPSSSRARWSTRRPACAATCCGRRALPRARTTGPPRRPRPRWPAASARCAARASRGSRADVDAVAGGRARLADSATPSRRSRTVRAGPGAARDAAAVEAGKARFDRFRAALDRPAGAAGPAREAARDG